MQDKITQLCSRFLAEDDPDEFQPVAIQLQSAICERVERVRRNALAVALEQTVGRQAMISELSPKESAT